MTTWRDVQQHMRIKYRLQEDTPDMLSMVWTYGDDRSQKIVVRRFKDADRDMIEFKSPFAERGQVDPVQMLEENSKLPLAQVALSGNFYLLIYNVLLENLHFDDFDFVLRRVAAIADSLEAKYVQANEF